MSCQFWDVLNDVRIGSLAACQHHIRRVAAIECEAVIRARAILTGTLLNLSQALLIRGVHQSPTKSIARVLSNCSGESTTPCSSIRSITARWDRALYQYQPGKIGVSDVQWVDFTLACYAMRHLCRIFSSSVVVRCPLWVTSSLSTV